MFKRFLSDRGGATAIEYALIAVLVSVAITGVVGTLGQTLLHRFYQPTADAFK